MHRSTCVSLVFLTLTSCGGSRESSPKDGGEFNGDGSVDGAINTGGSSNTGGTGTGGSNAGMGGNATGGTGGAIVDEAAKPLMGKPGITGKIDGTLFAYALEAGLTGTGPTTPAEMLVSISAKAATGQGSWDISKIPRTPGTYPCVNSGLTIQANLSLSGAGVLRGSSVPSLGGNCEVKVKSGDTWVEGSFTASLKDAAATRSVTDGYFRVHGPACGDWPVPADIPASENGANISVTAESWVGGPPGIRCGPAERLKPTVVIMGDAVAAKDRIMVFSGEFGGQPVKLTIREVSLNAPGMEEKPCSFDRSSSSSPTLGTCTVVLTERTATGLVGTFTGSVKFQTAVTTFRGSIRVPLSVP